MKLEVKITENKQKVLIVSKTPFPFLKIFKAELEKSGNEIFFSSKPPKKIESYKYCFFINEEFEQIRLSDQTKIIFIFINQEKKAEKLVRKNLANIKVISVKGEELTQDKIDKILWYSLSQSREPYLKMLGAKIEKPKKLEHFKKHYDFKKIFSFQRLILFLAILIFLMHTFFLLPLGITSFLTYQTFQNLKKENYQQAANSLKRQQLFLSLTKKSFSLARPTLLFLSLANFPNTLIEINEKTSLLFDKVLVYQKGLKDFFDLILKKNKTEVEKKLLSLRFNTLKKDLEEFEENLTIINNNLPKNFTVTKAIGKNIITALEAVTQFKKILPYLDDLLAKDSEKKYLLLFANNMELRPGGGFIGSFGVLTTKNYALDNIQIYDVYDADGQLTAHIEPPPAIRNYLNQPHWFLRDSAFSPDFLENYAQAKFFLEKEINLSHFSGAILVTTTAIENILDAFGDLYLPEFQETVNKKNFYLKTQYYSEKNFFPGSLQKKSFLSSLMTQVLLNLDSASAKKLLISFKKSFDEKQLVAYFDNPQFQEILESLFWSGRVIDPKCEKIENCIADFLLPIDANLGVNKANFYINRLITLKTAFNSQGQISHSLTVVFKNESAENVFPGGSYKNYFQVYLPAESTIKTITNNGTLVEPELISNELKNDLIRVVGFLVNVPPKSTVEIKINYELNQLFKKGKGLYQLIVQKQIGSANNDLVLEISLPKNYYLLNQNYLPLVKDNQILYNTNLTTDKIFLTELIKE
jgi:hypothetical protein